MTVVVLAADRLAPPAVLKLVIAPWIVADFGRRLRDYPQFRRLRSALPLDFWRGTHPLRHYFRMVADWQQSLAIYILAGRLHEARWQKRIQIRGTPPDALAEWGKRPVIIACLHTGGFILLAPWMRSRGMAAASLVRARPPIIHRRQKRDGRRLAGERELPNALDVKDVRTAVRFLTNGRAMVVAIDAHPPSRTLTMGAQVGINDGAARLAILCNALLIPASVWIEEGSNLLFCFGEPVPQKVIEGGEIAKANEYLTRELWNDLSSDPCAIGWTTLEAYAPEELIRPRLAWP